MWTDPVDAPDVLPVQVSVGKSMRVRDNLGEIGRPFYRDTLYFVTNDKKRPKAMIARRVTGSAMPVEDLPESLQGVFRSPAMRDGRRVPSEVRSILIYNPESAARKGNSATPRLLRVVPPRFPAERDAGGRDKLVVEAQLEIGADGAVTNVVWPESLGAAFVRLGLRAVSQWEFAPARSGGQPVAGAVTVPVIFQRTFGTEGEGKYIPPKLAKSARPVYPTFMRRAGVEGRVKVAFEVTVEGRTANVYPVESNNPNFEDAAVDAVSKWTFEPAQVDGRPVRVRMGVPVIFNIQGGGSSMYRVKRPKSFPDTLPEVFHFDEPPEVLNVASPVYPLSALREDREGKVKVGFYIGPDGYVEKSAIATSGGADLDGATIAAVEKLRFKPAIKDGKPSYAALRMEFEFKASGHGDVQVDHQTKRLLRLLETDREQLLSLAELDEVPEPVSRQPPVYPRSLGAAQANGTALIEFVIDRRGFARLPRVVSASDPAFGYAAVQAVASWRFQAPRRDGKLVDAIARIPVEFKRE